MKIKRTSNGWVKMSVDSNLRDSLKKAGVWSDKMKDHMHTVWVPRWVRDAVKLYNKGEGFAGLSMSEFLSSMNPVR